MITRISKSEIEDITSIQIEEISEHDRDEMAIPTYMHQNPLIRWLMWKRYDCLAEMIDNQSGATLEFGCGIGLFLSELDKRCSQVFATDLYPQYAMKLCDKKNINVNFVNNLNNIEDSSLDVIVAADVLEHIEELGNETPQQMVIFCKPNSAISQSLAAVRDEALHFEGEICFVVKNGGLHAVGFGLDLTKRELQSSLKAKGLPWERAKAFDGAACFSDFVTLGDTDIRTLSLELVINGELRQSGGYQLMMHKPDQIVDGIQRFMRLDDGDIIMTGTPKGVGQVASGDRFEGSVKSRGGTLTGQSWIAE